MKEKIYELCPHCNAEVSVLWDMASQGYLTRCPSCGKRLLLCSECVNRDGCDYDQESGLCRRVVETMWRELSDIPLEIPCRTIYAAGDHISGRNDTDRTLALV